MKKIFFTLLLFLPLIFPLPISAEEVAASITQDTYANEAYPDQPRGSVGSVILSNDPINRFGYLKFNLPDLPDGAIIDRGTLKFYIHEADSGEGKLNIGPVKDVWDGATLTWNSKPAIYPDQASESVITLSTGWKEITITNIVQKWYAAEISNNGLFIYPYGYLYGAAESDFAVSFRAKEGSSAEAAQLEIGYHFAPEPTATPIPTATPTPTPSPVPSPTVSPSPEPTEMPEETPEASPTPAEEESTGRPALFSWLIAGGLIGLSVVFALAWWLLRRPKKKKPAKKDKPEPASPPPAPDKPTE
ncbi:DNRLRE domain-containing protein [Patescibacteria group bacterium]|nr:DNRLRE domain-containing protein [Patescibacteria group bacterium]MBU1931834.1 DNRLRE domain-containing protein [Patescibacteria group bacterium]